MSTITGYALSKVEANLATQQDDGAVKKLAKTGARTIANAGLSLSGVVEGTIGALFTTAVSPILTLISPNALERVANYTQSAAKASITGSKRIFGYGASAPTTPATVEEKKAEGEQTASSIKSLIGSLVTKINGRLAPTEENKIPMKALKVFARAITNLLLLPLSLAEAALSYTFTILTTPIFSFISPKSLGKLANHAQTSLKTTLNIALAIFGYGSCNGKAPAPAPASAPTDQVTAPVVVPADKTAPAPASAPTDQVTAPVVAPADKTAPTPASAPTNQVTAPVVAPADKTAPAQKANGYGAKFLNLLSGAKTFIWGDAKN